MAGKVKIYVHDKPQDDRTDLFLVGNPEEITVRQLAIQTLLRVGNIEGVTVEPYSLTLQDGGSNSIIGWQDTYAFASFWEHFDKFHVPRNGASS